MISQQQQVREGWRAALLASIKIAAIGDAAKFPQGATAEQRLEWITRLLEHEAPGQTIDEIWNDAIEAAAHFVAEQDGIIETAPDLAWQIRNLKRPAPTPQPEKPPHPAMFRCPNCKQWGLHSTKNTRNCTACANAGIL